MSKLQFNFMMNKFADKTKCVRVKQTRTSIAIFALCKLEMPENINDTIYKERYNAKSSNHQISTTLMNLKHSW